MANNEMKKYDFIEGIVFDGLEPKAMEGYSTGDGGDAKSNHLFRSAHLGADALEVISINALFEKSEGGKEEGSESGGTESGETEHEVVKPEETENTPEQEQASEDVVAGMTAESGSTRYATSAESINNITVPENATRTGSISGAVQNGATFTNETSGKSLMVCNTSEEPADVSVVTNGGNVYLKGEYNDIYLSGKSLPVESSQYPNVHGTISVEDTNQPVSVTVNFVGEDCGIDYLGDETLTVSDGVTAVTASPEIYAPNATVEIGGKYFLTPKFLCNTREQFKTYGKFACKR